MRSCACTGTRGGGRKPLPTSSAAAMRLSTPALLKPASVARAKRDCPRPRRRSDISLVSRCCPWASRSGSRRRRWLAICVSGGVPVRTHAESLQPLGRRPCPENLVFRAYTLGFVWGDLAVDVATGDGRTVSVRGSTTQSEQVGLVRELFEAFGRVTVSQGRRSTCVRASLDESFAFLRQKYGPEVPGWVCGAFPDAAFAAGYIDAEGSFGVYEGRARFKLDSTDAAVHAWFRTWAGRNGIPIRARLVERAGVRSTGQRLNGDLYRVNVNDALGLRRLVATIEPFSRHERRRATMELAADNVAERMRARVFP